MMIKKKFLLNNRPNSYWGPQSLEKYFSSHITGELRRKAVKSIIKEDGIVPKFSSVKLPDNGCYFNQSKKKIK